MCFAVLLSVDYSITAELVDKIMLRIQDYSDQLATTTGQLATTTDQLATTTDQLATTTGQLATSTALNENCSQQLATTSTQLAIATALNTQLQVTAYMRGSFF